MFAEITDHCGFEVNFSKSLILFSRKNGKINLSPHSGSAINFFFNFWQTTYHFHSSFCQQNQIYSKTRMHSSRMRTGRTLTIFRSRLVAGGCTCLVRGGTCLVRGGTCLVQGGVPAWSGGCTCLVQRGLWSQGVSGPGGGTCLVPGGVPGQVPPLWTEFLTHACENITLAKTSFRPVIMHKSEFKTLCMAEKKLAKKFCPSRFMKINYSPWILNGVVAWNWKSKHSFYGLFYYILFSSNSTFRRRKQKRVCVPARPMRS